MAMSALSVGPSLYLIVSQQIPVLIARDHTSNTTDAILSRASAQVVCDVLEPILDHDAILCSDGSPVYVALAKQLHIAHQQHAH